MDNVYEHIEAVLFKGKEDAEKYLSPREMETKKRWMLCVSKLLDDPAMLEKDLADFLMNGCGGVTKKVSVATAYRDIACVNRLVGNIKLASKNWYRHLIIEACKKGIAIATKKEDAVGIAANADKIGKYTKADKEDDETDRSQWAPPVFEPSDDVTLLGENFKSIPDLEEKRKKLRSLFKNDKDIVDIEPEKDDDNGKHA